MFRHVNRIGIALICSGLIAGFGGGVVAGRTLFATDINVGLVSAFSSVGQNLFGDSAFGSRYLPPNPVLPVGAVQMDVSSATRIPIRLGVFLPPNPIFEDSIACHRLAEISIDPAGGHKVVIDAAYASDISFEYGDLSSSAAPNVSTACATGVSVGTE